LIDGYLTQELMRGTLSMIGRQLPDSGFDARHLEHYLLMAT
jgi:hypothetical protein